ncbi:MAG: hypothetical protein WD467_02440 [Candidatus Saccharimonadales bacterium]
MSHSHKVFVATMMAIVVASVAAYLLLDEGWFQALLPFSINQRVETFSVFAVFFIFIFDVLVFAIETPVSQRTK